MTVKTETQFAIQNRFTHHETGKCGGWINHPESFDTLDDAVARKEQQRIWSARHMKENAEYKDEMQQYKVEQRIIKQTLTTEVVEEAEVFKT